MSSCIVCHEEHKELTEDEWCHGCRDTWHRLIFTGGVSAEDADNCCGKIKRVITRAWTFAEKQRLLRRRIHLIAVRVTEALKGYQGDYAEEVIQDFKDFLDPPQSPRDEARRYDCEQGLTVLDLQAIVMSWPTRRENGTLTEVWCADRDGNSNLCTSVWPLDKQGDAADILIE